MSRRTRYGVEGIPQHIVQRGNNRQPCFIRHGEYLFYLECLREASAKHMCEIHAYVLMMNHVHILATPRRPEGISNMMQSIGRRYVQHFNWKHGRTGTLWEGRYKASLVDSDRYFLACSRYIEDNPVRAGIASSPEEYPWSSYHHHAAGYEDPLIKDHPVYLGLGSEPENRAAEYKKIFGQEAEQALLEAIRTSIRKELVLGGDPFLREIEARLNRRVRPGDRGRPRKGA